MTEASGKAADVTLWESADKLVAVSLPSCLVNLLLSGSWFAIANVLEYPAKAMALVLFEQKAKPAYVVAKSTGSWLT